MHKGDNKDDDDDDDDDDDGDDGDDDDDNNNNNNNKFVELAICRMGTYSLHLEFCSKFRVDIGGKVSIFFFRISLERSY